MSMVTRCPNCSTSFKILSEQLKAHRGMVRCGACSKIFNAFDSLSTLHEEELAPEPEPEVVEPQAEVPLPAQPQVQVQADTPSEFSIPEPSAAVQEILDLFDENKPKRRAWPWLAGSALLLLLLLAQAAYLFRMQISISVPALKPALSSYCQLLGCRIPLPRRADLVGIESSTLQAIPDRAGYVLVSASIRNSAPYPQQYPMLELTLTDIHDSPIAKRVVAPVDYLPPGARLDSGIGANAAVSVGLILEIGAMQAAGYRLYLYYP